MAGLSSQTLVYNVPQILRVWVGWYTRSPSWKLVFIAYKQCVIRGAAQLGNLCVEQGQAQQELAVRAQVLVRLFHTGVCSTFPTQLLQCRLAPSACFAYAEGYGTWESEPGFLGQPLNCLKINVELLSSQIINNLKRQPHLTTLL